MNVLKYCLKTRAFNYFRTRGEHRLIPWLWDWDLILQRQSKWLRKSNSIPSVGKQMPVTRTWHGKVGVHLPLYSNVGGRIWRGRQTLRSEVIAPQHQSTAETQLSLSVRVFLSWTFHRRNLFFWMKSTGNSSPVRGLLLWFSLTKIL